MSLVEHREGIEAGRPDMCADGAFAFTLSLPVTGRDTIPSGSAGLLRMPGGIPAFAASFSMIAFFRHGHMRWRQHCLRADGPGLFLLLPVFFALLALSMPLSAPPFCWSPPGRLCVSMFLIGPLATRFKRKHGMA